MASSSEVSVAMKMIGRFPSNLRICRASSNPSQLPFSREPIIMRSLGGVGKFRRMPVLSNDSITANPWRSSTSFNLCRRMWSRSAIKIAGFSCGSSNLWSRKAILPETELFVLQGYCLPRVPLKIAVRPAHDAKAMPRKCLLDFSNLNHRRIEQSVKYPYPRLAPVS